MEEGLKRKHNPVLYGIGYETDTDSVKSDDTDMEDLDKVEGTPEENDNRNFPDIANELYDNFISLKILRDK